MTTMIHLTPDREMLAQFAGLMFKHARPDAFVSLRLFPDKGSKNDKPIDIESIQIGDKDFLNITLIRATQAATWHEPAVFCPPVATFRDSKNAKTDNLCEGPCLSVECDQSPYAACAALEALLGAATAVVTSGGEWTDPQTGEIEPKVHLHWRLKKPTSTKAEHELLKEARTLATRLVGGDATNIAIVHPIRWPGSWHRKGTPRLATIVASSDDNEIGLSEALERLRDAAGALDFGQAGVKSKGKLEADDHATVAAALAVIPNDKLEWDAWNRIGMATWAATSGSDVGRKAFHAWSAKSAKNDPAATEARWQHYRTSPPTSIGFGTLVYLARKHSPGWSYGSTGPVEPVDLWAKFDPPSLPRGLLPKAIEDFAFDQGMEMGGDMSGIAVGALAVCAAAIPDGIKLQVKKNNESWLESARLWVALIGDVSAMKTPIMGEVVAPLQSIDNAMALDNQDAMDEWLRLPAAAKRMTPKPKQPRVMMMNITPEAAQDTLKDSPNGVLLFRDELAGWFGSIDKYTGSARGAASADRAFWLESYNGKPHTVGRVGRGNLYITNLSISVLGGIQPGPIRQIAKESVDDGLLQRMNPVMLSAAVASNDEPPKPSVHDYNALVRKLNKLRPPKSRDLLAGAANLRFDDGALAIRRELELKHLKLSQCGILNRKLASHIGKYNGMFARLCVIWHCIEHAGGKLPVVVTEDTARRVKGFLHGFLLSHAVAFYASVLGLSTDHDTLTSLAGYILAHPEKKTISYRDCMRGDTNMKALKPCEAEEMFEQLHGLAWVTRVPGARLADRASWIVNPAVHEKFAERSKAEAERRKRDQATIVEMSGGSW